MSGEPSLPVEHGMDVPPGTELPEGFDLGDGVRRDSHCVANWPGCDSSEYNPACCRFPKSCSATSVANRVYRAGILEPASEPTPTRYAAADLVGPPAEMVARAWSEVRVEFIRSLRSRAAAHNRIAAMGGQDDPEVQRMLAEMGHPTYAQQAIAERALADQIEALTLPAMGEGTVK